MLEDLLAETMSLLASHNLSVRETVKDVLGHELPLSCGNIMFSQLAKYVIDLNVFIRLDRNAADHFRLVSQAATMSSTASEYFTSLCDQAIAIIRTTADRAPRIGQPSSASPNSPENTGARTSFGDISELLVTIGRHLHRLPRDDGARLKSRYCQTLEVVLERQGFGIGTSGANAVLDLLLDWSNESGRVSCLRS